MRVLVTGASGFVGGAVAERLVAHGHEVVGSVRRADAVVPDGVQRVSWELPKEPAEHVPEPDAIVHCAALVDDVSPLSQAFSVNRGGTAVVASAFPNAHFVYVSSSSVYDSWTPHRGTCEHEADSATLLGSYAKSKAAADKHARSLDGSLVVRPHGIYGPGDRTLMPRLRRAAVGGVLPLPRGGRALHALTHIDTLVDAIVLGVEQRAAGVINVTDANPVQLRDAVAAALRGVRIVPVPTRVALAAVGASSRVLAAVQRPPRTTPYAVLQLANDHVYSLVAARSLLGWTPGPSRIAELATLR